MKVRIEIEEGRKEEEVVILCGEINDLVMNIQNYIIKAKRRKAVPDVDER